MGDSDCPSGPSPDKAQVISTLNGLHRDARKEFPGSFGDTSPARTVLQASASSTHALGD
jgi:hypothetical protein